MGSVRRRPSRFRPSSVTDRGAYDHGFAVRLGERVEGTPTPAI